MADLIRILLALLVAATGLTRSEDPALMEMAQRRAVEVSCEGCFDHSGQRDLTAEVLVWNQGVADPASAAVEQWRGSPTHWAILTDPAYTRIGCGHVHTADGRDIFACVLQADPALVTSPPPTPTQVSSKPPVAPPVQNAPILQLPDTAMETP